MMRGWRRIGIVLSVFWCIGFSWWLLEVERENDRRLWIASGWNVCDADAKDKREQLSWNERERIIARVDREERECKEKAAARFHSMVEIKPWWGFAVANAISLALLWLLAWIVVCVGRWVAAGFRQQA
jgi:hypothetical protein